MYDMDSEIIVCNSTKTKDIKDIDKAIEKLKNQEKKLVDLYLSSTLNVETINHKNDVIKKEIENLIKKKQQIDPNNDFTDYQNEFYETVSKKKPNSRRISTAGKDKMYVSRIIAQILNVQELTDRNI